MNLFICNVFHIFTMCGTLKPVCLFRYYIHNFAKGPNRHSYTTGGKITLIIRSGRVLHKNIYRIEYYNFWFIRMCPFKILSFLVILSQAENAMDPQGGVSKKCMAQVHPHSRCERRASGQCSEFKLEDFSQSLFGSAFFDCRLGIGQ